jgi:hypothetical protein
MKISYLTILVLGGVFSVIAIYSRRRKVSPSKELQNENKDKVKSTSAQGRYLAQTAVGEDATQVKAVATSGIGFEGEKVRRVKKYKSNGKPIYE